ncbi:hypothetical protein TraAM80_06546 [Trypanosoma rangeli]|uniref:Uncharacterized protein n=1 Tax=Trypanosoma rangeli TaxID=5698 RepID=A0A3R7K5V9_TRYRA|nr:uncharacterized protein TraAM80_06546 [Trypanosoma rangeli]RNF02252.1 hypothetical protein TraAM80_06546 [Trypanosoma rangeli]|eukprot:RNF02252.1 hypothetical protein TraAM80_06546 [Trypanosoma rangeli]
MWPTWVLNEKNRKLQQRIDRITDDLQSKAVEVELEREAVTLLRRNLTQVQQHVHSSTMAATKDQQRLQRDDDALQALRREASHSRAELHALQSRHKEVHALLQGLSHAVRTKAEALGKEQEASAALEQAALEISAATVSYKNAHEVQRDVERRRHRLEKVRASLAGAHNALRVSQVALQREVEEFVQVQRELEALQLNILRGKRERTESWLAVSHVQEAIEACETQTAANAETYASGARAVEAYRAFLQQLQRQHQEQLARRQALSGSVEGHRRNQHALLARLHAFTSAAQEQENAVAAMQRQVAAQRDVKRHATLSHRNTLALRDARHAQLQQLQLRLRELAGLAMEVREGEGVQSTRSLENTRASLQRGLRQLEGQVERIQAATLACFSELQQEGRLAEGVSDSVMKAKAALTAADRDYAAQLQSHERCQTHLGELEAQLSSMQQSLGQTRELMREQRQHEQTVLNGVVQELRSELHRVTQRGLTLRRDLTPLQCALNAHSRLADDTKAKLSALTEALQQRRAELHGLVSDAAQLVREKETALLHHSRATLELRSVRRAAESNVELMRESASFEDVLRGQALVLEETVLADIKNTVVELHLDQKAQAEKQAELRGRQEQVRQLKRRYQSLVEMLNQRLVAARRVGEEELQHETSTTSSPETIHARCILQASLDRERLRERGNLLDGRIVFLEHETKTLRKMLSAMRAGWDREEGKQRCLSGPTERPNAEVELLQLREGVTEGRRNVERELQCVTEVLRNLQTRKRDLSQRRKDVIRRLSELKALKARRECVLRRLTAQVKRSQQKLRPR